MLTSVAEMTSLPVPRIRVSLEGSLTSSVVGSEINGPRMCSVLQFVAGRPVDLPQGPGNDSPSTAAHARSLGSIHATLHRVMDHTFSTVYLLSDSSFEWRSAIRFHNRNTLYTYDSTQGSLFREAIDRVQEVLDDLWQCPPHEPYALHGDVGLHNLLSHRGRLFPIDFQDCFVGFDVQDIGITLADFRRPSLAPFREAYIQGYTERRVMPEISPSLLDVFAMQRILDVMNLELNLKPHGFVGYIDRNTAAIVDWMHR